MKRIGVPLFKDRTGKLGLDARVTAAVINELMKRGRFTVGKETAGADAVVEGEIKAYTVQPVGFSGSTSGTDVYTQASRYAIAISASVVYRKIGQKEPLWSNDVVLAARRVRHGRQRVQLLRPRGAVDGPPGRGVRAQPGRGDARGLLARVAKKAPGRPATVHVVLGEDTYLAEEALEQILADAIGDDRAEGLTVLYGDEARWESVLAGRAHGLAVRGPPGDRGPPRRAPPRTKDSAPQG